MIDERRRARSLALLVAMLVRGEVGGAQDD
jgi:hypothetical protein